MDTTESDQRLKEMILYIALRSDGDECFGATKLNNLLFYADFLAYLVYGKSITGAQYQKLENGPAPRRLVPVRTAMQSKNEIAIRKAGYYGLTQDRVIALRDPELSAFSAKEIAMVETVIAEFRGMSGTDMSNKSHRFVGWQLAKNGEDIPYQTALVGRRDLTEQEREWAHELIADAESVRIPHGLFAATNH